MKKDVENVQYSLFYLYQCLKKNSIYIKDYIKFVCKTTIYI